MVGVFKPNTLRGWPTPRLTGCLGGTINLFRPLFMPSARLKWQEQNLGQAGADLCTGILAASTSADQLRDLLSKLTRRVSGLGALFAG